MVQRRSEPFLAASRNERNVSALHVSTAPSGFLESRIATPVAMAAISTQAPFPALSRALRHCSSLVSEWDIDMQFEFSFLVEYCYEIPSESLYLPTASDPHTTCYFGIRA